MTPRVNVDEDLIAIAPRKQPRRTIIMLPPTVKFGEGTSISTFDGSARVKNISGYCKEIIWKSPEWTIVAAAS